jgi:hypothetical protein
LVRCDPHALRRYRLGSRDFASPTPPELREAALEILSWACALLQSTTTRRAAATTPSKPNVAAPSVRFGPLQRIPARAKGMKCPGLPHPERQAPTGSHNLLTLRNAPRLPAVFQARSAHGVGPSRALSLSRSRAPSPGRYPHVVRQQPRSATDHDQGHEASSAPKEATRA